MGDALFGRPYAPRQFGGAIISIMPNPLFFVWLDRMNVSGADETSAEADAMSGPRRVLPETTLTDHIVLVGHGRVGRVVSAQLRCAGTPLLIIENDDGAVEKLQHGGFEAITGNAAATEVLEAANISKARGLLVAIPDGFEGGQIVAKARALNPDLMIVARSHSDDETAHLAQFGANEVIMGETEIAHAMVARIAVGAAAI